MEEELLDDHVDDRLMIKELKSRVIFAAVFDSLYTHKHKNHQSALVDTGKEIFSPFPSEDKRPIFSHQNIKAPRQFLKTLLLD